MHRAVVQNQNGNSALILKLEPSARFTTPDSRSNFAVKNQPFPLSYLMEGPIA
jgi:hypothetical protein